MTTTCAQHPDAAATHRCESCERALCPSCVKSGHALFFCALCGERAVPLEPAAAALGPREVARLAAISRPYTWREALAYPVRGSSVLMFAAALVSSAAVELLVRFGFGTWKLVVAFLFWSLLVGLQFRIVRTSAVGGVQLPDWPEYHALSERLAEIVVYLLVGGLQAGPPALYLWLGRASLSEPSLIFWAGFAVVSWIAAAVGTMAFAAAAQFHGMDALRFGQHVRAFRRTGADAVHVTNLVFGLGAVVLALRLMLAELPIVGAALGGVIGIYWLFVSAHFIGVLVRRHGRIFDELYA